MSQPNLDVASFEANCLEVADLLRALANEEVSPNVGDDGRGQAATA